MRRHGFLLIVVNVGDTFSELVKISLFGCLGRVDMRALDDRDLLIKAIFQVFAKL